MTDAVASGILALERPAKSSNCSFKVIFVFCDLVSFSVVAVVGAAAWHIETSNTCDARSTITMFLVSFFNLRTPVGMYTSVLRLETPQAGGYKVSNRFRAVARPQ